MDVRVDGNRGVQLTLSFQEIDDILYDLHVADRNFPLEVASQELVDTLQELGIK